MMTFAVALGVVTSSISVGLEGILEGNHKVVEKGHMVILNWNDKTVPMLRQVSFKILYNNDKITRFNNCKTGKVGFEVL